MKTFKKFLLLWIIVIVLSITGYVKCVIKFTKCDFKAPYKAEVLYGIGAFGLITGAIIGWIDISDEPEIKP